MTIATDEVEVELCSKLSMVERKMTVTGLTGITISQLQLVQQLIPIVQKLEKRRNLVYSVDYFIYSIFL